MLTPSFKWKCVLTEGFQVKAFLFLLSSTSINYFVVAAVHQIAMQDAIIYVSW